MVKLNKTFEDAVEDTEEELEDMVPESPEDDDAQSGDTRRILSDLRNGKYTPQEILHARAVKEHWPDGFDRLEQGRCHVEARNLPIERNRFLQDLFKAGVSSNSDSTKSHDGNGRGEVLVAWLMSGSNDTGTVDYDFKTSDESPGEVKEGCSPQLNKMMRGPHLEQHSEKYNRLRTKYSNIISLFLLLKDRSDELPSEFNAALAQISDRMNNRFDRGHHVYSDDEHFEDLTNVIRAYGGAVRDVIGGVEDKSWELALESGIIAVENKGIGEIIFGLRDEALRIGFESKPVPIVHFIGDDSVYRGRGSGSHTAFFICNPAQFMWFYILTRWNRNEHHVKARPADKKLPTGHLKLELLWTGMHMDGGQRALIVTGSNISYDIGDVVEINDARVRIVDRKKKWLLIEFIEGPSYRYKRQDLKRPRSVTYEAPERLFNRFKECRNGAMDDVSSLRKYRRMFSFIYDKYDRFEEQDFVKVDVDGDHPFEKENNITQDKDHTITGMIRRIARNRGMGAEIERTKRGDTVWIYKSDISCPLWQKQRDLDHFAKRMMEGEGMPVKSKHGSDDGAFTGTTLENTYGERLNQELAGWIEKAYGIRGRVEVDDISHTDSEHKYRFSFVREDVGEKAA